MTKRDLEDTKRKLLVERARITESLARYTEHTLSEIDDTTRDAGDIASASHDKDVLYQLQESDAKRLKLIDEVSSRIDRDGYGMCEHCGQEIGNARLDAIPWATSCLICQEKSDSKESLSSKSRIRALKVDGDEEYDAA